MGHETTLWKRYSDVEAIPVQWLWYPYIAIGKITLLQGDPGDGKSTMMLHIISELSIGGRTPDGKEIGAPWRVIYQCSEDGAADTIRPRLEACGANCENIAFIDEEVHDGLTLDDERIRQAIMGFHPRLVVIDPIQVVRSQFTQVRYEGPSISVSGDKISFNTFCMRCFASVGYIQLLLHPAERKIAIRPCLQKDTHSIRWRPDPEKKIYSKTISCPHFGSALYSIMEWNPEYTYRIRGVWASQGEEQIIVFNFSNAVPVVLMISENDQTRKKRIELCPEEWEDNFGEEFYEHVLDNGFYYLAPSSGWESQLQSIVAPGIKQYASTSNEELLFGMERLTNRGIENNGT